MSLSQGLQVAFPTSPPSFLHYGRDKDIGLCGQSGEGRNKHAAHESSYKSVPHMAAESEWYSRYSAVTKRNGKRRPILDLRVLNIHLRVFKFRMLTLR